MPRRYPELIDLPSIRDALYMPRVLMGWTRVRGVVSSIRPRDEASVTRVSIRDGSIGQALTCVVSSALALSVEHGTAVAVTGMLTAMSGGQHVLMVDKMVVLGDVRDVPAIEYKPPSIYGIETAVVTAMHAYFEDTGVQWSAGMAARARCPVSSFIVAPIPSASRAWGLMAVLVPAELTDGVGMVKALLTYIMAAIARREGGMDRVRPCWARTQVDARIETLQPGVGPSSADPTIVVYRQTGAVFLCADGSWIARGVVVGPRFYFDMAIHAFMRSILLRRRSDASHSCAMRVNASRWTLDYVRSAHFTRAFGRCTWITIDDLNPRLANPVFFALALVTHLTVDMRDISGVVFPSSVTTLKLCRVQLDTVGGAIFPRVLTDLCILNARPVHVARVVLPPVSRLTLRACSLRTLHGIRFPGSVKFLGLQGNFIRSLTGARFPAGLVHINLSRNALVDLQWRVLPSTLTSINLTGNAHPLTLPEDLPPRIKVITNGAPPMSPVRTPPSPVSSKDAGDLLAVERATSSLASSIHILDAAVSAIRQRVDGIKSKLDTAMDTAGMPLKSITGGMFLADEEERNLWVA